MAARLAAAKGEVGLDQSAVRQSHGWYRHLTRAMLALADRALADRALADRALADRALADRAGVRSHLPGASGATPLDPKGGPPWRSSVRGFPAPCPQCAGWSTAWWCASWPHRRPCGGGRAGAASIRHAPSAVTLAAA